VTGHQAGALNSILAGIRARLRGRPDTEPSRRSFGCLIAAYCSCISCRSLCGSEPNLPLFGAMICYFRYAARLFAWIYASRRHRLRAVFSAQFLDVGSTSAFM